MPKSFKKHSPNSKPSRIDSNQSSKPQQHNAPLSTSQDDEFPPFLPDEDTTLHCIAGFISSIGLRDTYHLEKHAIACNKRYGLMGLLTLLGTALAQLDEEDITWFCQQKSSVIPKKIFDPSIIADLRRSNPPLR